MKKIPLIIFLIASAYEVAAGFFAWPDFHVFVKPLIMLGLVAHYWLHVKQQNTVFIVALLFCWAGDCFLLFQSVQPIYFMAGLGSFLVGHMLYIFAYQQHRWPAGQGLMGPQKIRFTLPIVLAGTGLVVVLYPVLGDLKSPVMLYALIITLMSIQALLRFGFTSTKSFGLVFGGAVLFMISDSVLALNKFLEPIASASGWIMLTYCTAQFLIVAGILEHEKSN